MHRFTSGLSVLFHWSVFLFLCQYQNGFFLFWPHCMACGIFVPWPGVEPGPSAVTTWNPKHYTANEFPVPYCFDYFTFVVQSLVIEPGSSSSVFLSQDCFGWVFVVFLKSGYMYNWFTSLYTLNKCNIVNHLYANKNFIKIHGKYKQNNKNTAN